MSAIAKTLDDIYESLHNDNENIDAHIASLKKALEGEAKTSVELDPTRLYQPNRQGRKLLQSYFKKRGVVVTFAE